MHIAMCCYLLRFDLLAMVTADSSCRIQKIKWVLLTYSYSEYFSTESLSSPKVTSYYCLLPCLSFNANMLYKAATVCILYEAATFLLCRLRRTNTTLLVASYYIQLGGKKWLYWVLMIISHLRSFSSWHLTSKIVGMTMLSIPPPLPTATYYYLITRASFLPVYYPSPSPTTMINRKMIYTMICYIIGASHIDQYLSYTMPKLCCCVDCGKIAAAAVAVNTSVGVGDSGPPTAPFDSAWKIGALNMLWVCFMIICHLIAA